jgi:hypothetical protein
MIIVDFTGMCFSVEVVINKETKSFRTFKELSKAKSWANRLSLRTKLSLELKAI